MTKTKWFILLSILLKTYFQVSNTLIIKPSTNWITCLGGNKSWDLSIKSIAVYVVHADVNFNLIQ